LPVNAPGVDGTLPAMRRGLLLFLVLPGCLVTSRVEAPAAVRPPQASLPSVSLERPPGGVELARIGARAWGFADAVDCQVRLLDVARELGAVVLVIDEPGVSPCGGVAFAAQ
jgi:hypothetical protein